MTHSYAWYDISNHNDIPNFNIDNYEWRVKPRKTQIAYRVRLEYRNKCAPYNNEYPHPILISCAVDQIDKTEKYMQNNPLFIRWLGDWNVIEIEEYIGNNNI